MRVLLLCSSSIIALPSHPQVNYAFPFPLMDVLHGTYRGSWGGLTFRPAGRRGQSPEAASGGRSGSAWGWLHSRLPLEWRHQHGGSDGEYAERQPTRQIAHSVGGSDDADAPNATSQGSAHPASPSPRQRRSPLRGSSPSALAGSKVVRHGIDVQPRRGTRRGRSPARRAS